jgi:hypothetical protein
MTKDIYEISMGMFAAKPWGMARFIHSSVSSR